MAKKLAFDRLLFSFFMILPGISLALVARLSPSALPSQYLATRGLAYAMGVVALWSLMHIDYRILRGKLGVLIALCLLVLPLFTRLWATGEALSLVLPALVLLFARSPSRVPGQAPRGNRLAGPAVAIGLATIVTFFSGGSSAAAILLATSGVILFVSLDAGRRLRSAAVVICLVGVGSLILLPANFILEGSDTDLLAVSRLEAPAADSRLSRVARGELLGTEPDLIVRSASLADGSYAKMVYASISEDFGLVGAFATLALFAAIFARAYVASLRAPDPFGRALAFGLGLMFSLQVLVHVSASLALLPAAPISLPLISSDLPATVIQMASAGLLLNVSQHG